MKGFAYDNLITKVWQDSSKAMKPWSKEENYEKFFILILYENELMVGYGHVKSKVK